MESRKSYTRYTEASEMLIVRNIPILKQFKNKNIIIQLT